MSGPARPPRLVPAADLVSRLVAAVGLLVCAPVLALAAVAVKASSRGPVLFRTARVGRGGEEFTMLKLRTMHPGPVSTSRITGGRDARVFPAGRLLRRSKVDELPQLVNVLRGDMVLVGPRPEDPLIVRAHYTPFMLQTLSVAPGLTSPGSLGYYADETALPDDPREAQRVYLSELLPRKIALDVAYLRSRSWRYDLEVLLRTAAAMIGIHGLFPLHRIWESAQADKLLADSAPSTRGSRR